MEWYFISIAIGIAVAGYFIGDGLKNFKNPNAKGLINSLDEDEDAEHELIKEKDVHYFMGISKEDAKSLIQEHSDIPHIIINSKVYYPKAKLRKWLLNLGDWSYFVQLLGVIAKDQGCHIDGLFLCCYGQVSVRRLYQLNGCKLYNLKLYPSVLRKLFINSDRGNKNVRI